MVRRHLLQQGLFPVQHADSRRAEQFMAGKGVEVTIQSDHIHSPVGYRLSAVNHHHRGDLMGQRGNLGYRIDRTQGIRDMGDCNNPGSLAQ